MTIQLPKLPDIPEHPAGWEVDPEEARRIIEEFAQTHWAIDWTEWRRRWNKGLFDLEEREQMRPVARLLQFAVIGLPRPNWDKLPHDL